MSSNKKCNICTIEIEPKTSFVYLGCDHVFHLSCYNFTRNIVSYCPVCVPPKLSLLGNLKQDKITQFPISFGDDYKIGELAKRRHALLQNYGFSGKSNTSIRISKVKSQLSSEDGDNNNNTSKIKTVSGAMSMLKNITLMVTADPTSKSYMESFNVTQWINDRQKSYWLSERGVDGQVLISNGFTMNQLFKQGYTIDDFVILKITWDNMVDLGFKEAKRFMECKQYFTIEQLHKIWGVTADRILVDVCGQHLTIFAKLRFTKEELKTLKFNFSILIIYEKRFATAQFFGLKLDEWKELGLTAEKLKGMKITSDVFKSVFNISNNEYKETFGEGIELLDNTELKPYTVSKSFDSLWEPDNEFATHNPDFFEIGN